METTLSFLISNSEAILLFVFFSLCYLLVTRFKIQKNGAFYFGGLVLMVTSLVLNHAFSTSMPFTIHMSIHILLVLVCAPLLVIGWPNASATHPLFNRVFIFLFTHPLFCWMTGIGIMWFWHIPTILEALMSAHHTSFSFIAIAHLGSLLIAGIIFTWPIVTPHKHYRIDPPLGIVYLFTACIACSLLGMLITFAPPEIYRLSMDMNGDTSMTSTHMINDQQAAGLMMWVPCCFLYLFGVLYLALNWLKEPNRQINKYRPFPPLS